MYSFSNRSIKNLESAHPDLQRLFNEVIKVIDCTVIFGHRTKEQQEEQFELGHTSLHFPRSLHNPKPSLAVDVVPYYANHKPHIDWHDTDKFYYFAGVVKGIASQLGIAITWGNDWDNDNDFKDTRWVDMPHYELL
ncbi:MAG: M15 family peptidase [Candidatus Dadabacteria bacterium]